jgi:hypothetical protein
MSARADPRGGRSAMVVPTATVNPPIGLTFHDDPNDDVPHKRGEGWDAIPNMSCSGGRKTPLAFLGPGPLGGLNGYRILSKV